MQRNEQLMYLAPLRSNHVRWREAWRGSTKILTAQSRQGQFAAL